MDLEGASAVVTGAASGIGAACARQLAAHGARVVVADLNAEKGEAVASEIGGMFVPVDVTSTTQIQQAVDQALELGPLRALVNSAGIGWAQRTIGRDGEYDSAHDLDAFKRVVAINLIGTFDAVRIGATAMSRNEPDEAGERGAIVNVSSVAAFDGQIGQAAYAASKGGLVGLTLPVARDLAASGIRLNTVAPGLIDTPIYDFVPEPEAFKEQLGQSVLFPKRLGTPDELAGMVLACLTNTYMNGETIRVDGGIRMPPKSGSPSRRTSLGSRPTCRSPSTSRATLSDHCSTVPIGRRPVSRGSVSLSRSGERQRLETAVAAVEERLRRTAAAASPSSAVGRVAASRLRQSSARQGTVESGGDAAPCRAAWRTRCRATSRTAASGVRAGSRGAWRCARGARSASASPRRRRVPPCDRRRAAPRPASTSRRPWRSATRRRDTSRAGRGWP